jgi:hypothetical protein
MKAEAVFLVQEWVLFHLPWPLLLPSLYQDLYHIPQILPYTQQFQVQCHMVRHQLQFLVVMHTSQDMDRVIFLGIIQ